MASLTSAAARYSEGVAGMEDYRSPWEEQPDQPAPSGSSGRGGVGVESTCCTLPRVLLLSSWLTLAAAAGVAAVLLAVRASGAVWGWAAAVFCGVRVAWSLWLARPSALAAGPPPGSGAPAKGCRVLSEEQLEFFDRCGYLVLPQAVAKSQADAFAADTVFPGLRQQGIDPADPQTWHTGEKWQAALPACCRGGRNVANHNRCGAMVGAAVPPDAQAYPPLFTSPTLLGALDDLHGTDTAPAEAQAQAQAQAQGSEGAGGRRWQWLGPGGGTALLGSTHIRYPLPSRQPWWFPAQAAARLWRPPNLGCPSPHPYLTCFAQPA